MRNASDHFTIIFIAVLALLLAGARWSAFAVDGHWVTTYGTEPVVINAAHVASAFATCASIPTRESSSMASTFAPKASTSISTSARWGRRSNMRAAQRQLEILREMGFLMIVRGISGQSGTIKLTAASGGLKIGAASITTTLKRD